MDGRAGPGVGKVKEDIFGLQRRGSSGGTYSLTLLKSFTQKRRESETTDMSSKVP